ncbi:MAG: tripartite tricarboxylate transporter substrate binding protein [Burkholderiaceae bacterium]
MKTRSLRNWIAGMVAGAALLAAPAAQAAFPERPITLVVGFAPGGSTDILARILAENLMRALGQSVVVENKPGATGTVAARLVAQAKPDGHTLLFAAPGHTIAPALFPLQYDAKTAFSPISKVAALPNILVVHPSVPARSVDELIAYARANPGKLNFASAGASSVNRMASELFMSMAGVQMNHVPYKGSGQALIDLIAGRVQVAFDQASSVLQPIAQGNLIPLAVTTPQRFSQLPDTPSLDEAGLKGYQASSWNGILAPAGTPAEIIETLARTIRSVVHTNQVKQAFAKAGATAIGDTPQEFTAFIDADLAKWRHVVKTNGIRID